MTRSRAKALACVLVIGVAAAGCGGGDGGGGGKAGEGAAADAKPPKYDPLKGVESPAATLRTDLTALLQEHVLLSAIATADLVQATPAPATPAPPAAAVLDQNSAPATPAAAVLDQNSAELAAVVRRLYGEPTGTAFLDLWRRHVASVTEFASGSGAGDQARMATAKADLDAFRTSLAALMNGVNPQITVEALGDDLETYLTKLLAVVTAQAKKDATATTKLREAAHHMATTAIILVAGIAKQKSKEIPGQIDAMGAAVRASFTARFQEHAYLTGITTGAAVAGGDTEAVAEVLDENSLELSRAVGAVYGDDSARRFLDLWRKHIGFLVDLADGARLGDQARIQGATVALDRNNAAVAAFLADTSPNLSQETVEADLDAHVTSLVAAIRAQAANDPSRVLRLREAAGHMQSTARLLSVAIARQFPVKFG